MIQNLFDQPKKYLRQKYVAFIGTYIIYHTATDSSNYRNCFLLIYYSKSSNYFFRLTLL